MRMRTLKQLKITFSCFCKNCYRLANATVDILWLNIKATKHFFKHEQSNVHTAKITDTEVKRRNTLAWLRFLCCCESKGDTGRWHFNQWLLAKSFLKRCKGSKFKMTLPRQLFYTRFSVMEK